MPNNFTKITSKVCAARFFEGNLAVRLDLGLQVGQRGAVREGHPRDADRRHDAHDHGGGARRFTTEGFAFHRIS